MGEVGRSGINHYAAGGFASAAPTYARIRPAYSRAAIGAIKERVPDGAIVLDVAAGTGILSGQLRRSRLSVVAVEPVREMLGQLRLTLPDVPPIQAVAEVLPVAEGSVDAVTVGEALHWFGDAAVPEFRRVLRHGGVLAVARNRRDESVDWMACYGRIIHSVLDGARPYERRDPVQVIGSTGGLSQVEFLTVANPRRCTPEELVQRAASTSFVATAAPAEREAVLDRVRDLALTHPDLAGRDSFEFPYVTELWMWQAI